MAVVRIKLDIGGTVGDEAWSRLRHFEQAQAVAYGPEYGTSGECRHRPEEPHARGEWRGAAIRVPTPLLAQYAMSHYLEQERVLDADVE